MKVIFHTYKDEVKIKSTKTIKPKSKKIESLDLKKKLSKASSNFPIIKNPNG